MSETIDPNAALRAKIAHMQAVLEGKYKPEETESKIATIEESRRKLNRERLVELATLYNHFRLADEPIPKVENEIPDNELHELLELALKAFPHGANGQQLADYIGDSRITSKRISTYQEEAHRLVRSETGLNTKFRIATPAEVKAAEEALKAEQEAERKAAEVAEAATKAASTKKPKGKRS